MLGKAFSLYVLALVLAGMMTMLVLRACAV
jgi:hypothetical protein